MIKKPWIHVKKFTVKNAFLAFAPLKADDIHDGYLPYLTEMIFARRHHNQIKIGLSLKGQVRIYS